jgi:outer membrane lipoprotein-sorting protein
MLVITSAWAVYISSNSVQITADVRSTNIAVNVKAAEYFLDAITGIDGGGTAMSAADGAFDSTNETAVATFTPSFPYGERHIIFLHAEGSDGQWTPFKQVILNPNVNDILNKIQANYSAFQDLQFNVTITETRDGTVWSTKTGLVRMKGPYELRTDYDDGTVAIKNFNQTWWYNNSLNIGGALTSGLNGDWSSADNRKSDYFWDVPLCETRNVATITSSSQSANFGIQLQTNAGLPWPSQNSQVDYTRGFVTEADEQPADFVATSQYLNPTEVMPGHWLFTVHTHTLSFNSGATIIRQTTISNIVVNQGLNDSRFNIPTQ